MNIKSILFQFTHPCGCDNGLCKIGAHKISFNSRTRVGATFIKDCERWIGGVSIHAPVWVRPSNQSDVVTVSTLFQFTHPCGCDQRWMREVKKRWSFNSRTRVGATKIPCVQCHIPCRFNSRTRVGATETLCISMQSGIVSIHAPVWVRLNEDVNTYITHGFQFTHPCGCDGLTNTV